MSLRGDIEDFPVRPLPVSPEKRHEAAELIPAGIELTPLPEILILLSCTVVMLLRGHITVLHAESAYIHCPIWHTCHGEVQAGGNLRPHILPSGGNVTAPGGSGITLLACKA